MGLLGDLARGAYTLAKNKNEKLQTLYDKYNNYSDERIKKMYQNPSSADQKAVCTLIMNERGLL